MKAQSCVVCATSLPSSTVDQSTGEDNNYYNVLNKNFSNSGLLFIMYGHCSPAVV